MIKEEDELAANSSNRITRSFKANLIGNRVKRLTFNLSYILPKLKPNQQKNEKRKNQ
jgi:hypothetical protein